MGEGNNAATTSAARSLTSSPQKANNSSVARLQRLPFTENFTTKLQKIRKTKPQYNSNSNNNNNSSKIYQADSNRSPDSHRPSNSKPRARSRSKQPVLMHESVTPTGIGLATNPASNSLSRQVFVGHQVAAPQTHPSHSSSTGQKQLQQQ